MGIISFKTKPSSQKTMKQMIKEQRNIQIGLKFMKKDGVEVVPLTVRRVFLQKKGLKEEEIEKVFRLHEEIKQKRFKDGGNDAKVKENNMQNKGGKQVVQQSAKQLAKQTCKQDVFQVSKQAVKEGAKQVSKQGVNQGKQGAEQTLAQSAKQSIKQNLSTKKPTL